MALASVLLQMTFYRLATVILIASTAATP